MKLAVLGLVAGLAYGFPVHAEPPSATEPSEEWELVFTPYIWAMRVHGDLRVGRLEADVDVTFREILEGLNMAAMGAVEARKGRHGILLDGLVGLIEDDTSVGGPLFTIGADARLRQVVSQGLGFYRALSMPLHVALGRPASDDPRQLHVDLGAGMRYWNLDVKLKLDIPLLGRRRIDRQEAWVDPILGARVLADLTERLRFTLIADLGGFGIGSATDFTWGLWGLFRYDLSERSSLHFGYRALNIDRSQGDDKLDLTFHGPTLGVSFRFF